MLMNIKLFSSICIVIIIILIVIIDDKINKEEEDKYIINGENFYDYDWNQKYGNYFNKNKYTNYFVKPSLSINWSKKC